MAAEHTRLNRIRRIRADAARITDLVAQTRQILVATKELRSKPLPDTFVGRKTHEPFLKELKSIQIRGREPTDITQVSAKFGNGSHCGCFCDEGETLSEQPCTVLVVEDEYLLLADLEKALTDAGFVVEIASSGEEAFALFTGGNMIYRALVTDVRLGGGMTGLDVARCIRERESAFPVVYVTGSSAEEWASEGVPNSILISKPFAVIKLTTAVASLLNIRTSSIA